MELYRLSIRQQFSQIGVNTTNAEVQRSSSPGELVIDQEPAQMAIESHQGALQIDSGDAWAAYAKGGHLRWLNYVYSQSKQMVLQGIARIVEDGNRMGQVTNRADAVADLALAHQNDEWPVQYLEDASYLNVHIRYEPRKPDIRIEAQIPKIEYKPMQVKTEYKPGDVDIYLRQRNAIDIQVSKYDWYR